ncbi:MAG: ABC transporter permease [Bacteroidetes bacterium]|nr:ABC transporter permease [Bacteroidota bacterium]
MLNFILKRLFTSILVLLGIVSVVFFLFAVLPQNQLHVSKNEQLKYTGLDSLHKGIAFKNSSLSDQYLMYLNDLSPVSIQNLKDEQHPFFMNMDKNPNSKILVSFKNGTAIVVKIPLLHRSYQTDRSVNSIIIETLPETLLLVLTAIIIATFFGVFIGVVSALKKGNFFDVMWQVISVLGMASPSFFISILISWIFGYALTHYTGLNMTGSLYTQDDYGNGEYLDLRNILLPAIALSLRPLAIISQIMRSALLEVLAQDYMRTAVAKGIGTLRVLFKHALKNALNVVLTSISGWFAGLMASSVFVEYIFGWKGMGKELVDAIAKSDLPVAMGVVLVFAFIFICLNTLMDILYAVLDPRIKLA